MNYSIAIPSYKRSETLLNKTLAYLKKSGVLMSRVYIFVADKQEEKVYKALLFTEGVKIVVGLPTIKLQRNFIRHYFEEGEQVVSFDDDVEGLYGTTSTNSRDLYLITDLDKLIRMAFATCESVGLTLWGVNPVANGLFMYGKGDSVNLKFIVGAAFGFINRKGKKFDQTIEVKGDYERTLIHYIADGGVLRINKIAVKTKYYKEKGGIQEHGGRHEKEKACGTYLINKYPNHCVENTGKKNKEFFEVRLKENANG